MSGGDRAVPGRHQARRRPVLADRGTQQAGPQRPGQSRGAGRARARNPGLHAGHRGARGWVWPGATWVGNVKPWASRCPGPLTEGCSRSRSGPGTTPQVRLLDTSSTGTAACGRPGSSRNSSGTGPIEHWAGSTRSSRRTAPPGSQLTATPPAAPGPVRRPDQRVFRAHRRGQRAPWPGRRPEPPRGNLQDVLWTTLGPHADRRSPRPAPGRARAHSTVPWSGHGHPDQRRPLHPAARA